MQASLIVKKGIELLHNLANTDTEDMSNNLLGSLGNNFVFTHRPEKGVLEFQSCQVTTHTKFMADSTAEVLSR